MEYRINYSAIKQWLDANPIMTKKSINDCLNKKDYTKINKVVEGELPLDIEDLVRIANRFQIPLAVFFFNEDDDPLALMPFRHSIPDAELSLPKGGFPDPAERKSGPRRCSPIVERKEKTNIPELFRTTAEGKAPVMMVSPHSEPVSCDMSHDGAKTTEQPEQTEVDNANGLSGLNGGQLTDVMSQMLQTLKHIDRNVTTLANDKYGIGMAAEDIHN